MDNSILPSNQDAEAYLLSILMRSKEIRDEYLPLLKDHDFLFLEHKTIFKEILDLTLQKHDLSVDLVAAALKRAGRLDQIGGMGYMAELAFKGSGSDLEWNFCQIKEASINRTIASIAKEAYEKALANKGGESLVATLMKQLADITAGTFRNIKTTAEIVKDFQDGKTFLEVVRERMTKASSGQNAFDGIMSGYPRLDALIGGFQNGSLTLIGARTSMGKTTFLLNLIFNICEQRPEVQVGFFSLEMSKEILTTKMICTLAGVDFKKIRKGTNSEQDYAGLEKHSQILAEKYKVAFADESGLKISNLKSLTRRLVVRYGVEILFVDYLTLVQSDFSLGSKHLEVDQVSKGLQSLAKELNIPIVCLAQLNRSMMMRPDKRPVLTDLRESGSIEEDADLVLLLHRPKMFSKDDPGKEDLTEVYIAKNRIEGDLGKFDYRYHFGRLVELDKVEDIRPDQVYDSPPTKPTKPESTPKTRQVLWYDEN